MASRTIHVRRNKRLVDEKWKEYGFEKIKVILEMIKFSRTLFALPFAFMGAILSAKRFRH